LTIQSLPYILILGLLFGTTLVANRFGLRQFEPAAYVGLQLGLASISHAAFYLRRPLPADRNLWWHAAVFGTVGTALPVIAINTSLQYQSSIVTAIFITATPALTVLLAHFFLPDEPLTRRKVAGVALAFAGALLIALRGETGLPTTTANPLGYLFALVGITCSSGMAIYARKYMRTFDAFDVASIRMFIATLTVIPLVYFSAPNWQQVDGRGYLAVGYAGFVGTFAGLLLGFYVVKQFGATAAAMPAYIIPIVASIGGMLFLGETVTTGMIAGMALILAGIALLNERRQPPQTVHHG
jgi:drug/metabolite transporter (DMT)-like permease